MDFNCLKETTMLNDREKVLIKFAYQKIIDMLPGFSPRKQQTTMINKVASVFGNNKIGIVEAPTGTGKSVGYLLPGIIMAISRDKRLIVSTATAALQDQLARKDLPLVLSALEKIGLIDTKWAVAKGRERHVCPLKLRETIGQPDMFSIDSSAVRQITEISDIWDSGNWDGLRDTLPIKVARTIWAAVANTSASCEGDACSLRDSCPYYAAVDAAKRARVVITNHDYLLASFANTTSSVVCDSENNLYAFDEAHHLGDKCLSAFAKNLDLNMEPFKELDIIADMCSGNKHHLQLCISRLSAMWSATTHSVIGILGDASQHRFILGECPSDFLTLLLGLSGALKSTLDALDVCIESLSKKVTGATTRSAFSQMLYARCNAMKFELDDHLKCLEEFTLQDEQRARWLSRGRKSVEIKCSPFDSGVYARKYLWPRIDSAILTSATLSTLGNFNSMKHSLGLGDDIPTLRLDSPLDYSNARIRVPKLCVDAGTEGHLDMCIAQIRQGCFKAGDVGCLVYFTSKKMMESVFSALSPEEKALVLKQGEIQPSAMVEQHKQRIDAGMISVMFGLDSLGEGIDLPGLYCTKVFIPRLPFPSPDDPILATHAEYLKKRGLHPFSLLSLPRAGLKFAQICGRLIRKEGDWGDIVVMDNRMRSKNYGVKLLASTAFTELSY